MVKLLRRDVAASKTLRRENKGRPSLGLVNVHKGLRRGSQGAETHLMDKQLKKPLERRERNSY